jgi:hypothetical protein
VGGVIQSNNAKKAAKAAGQGSDAATEEQRRQYDQTRQDNLPFLQAGQGALTQMQALNSGDFSSFKESPDYQWTFNQGLQGLDRGAASRGGLYSGGADADRIAYGQGMASQQYGTYYNRLQAMAGQGQTTAGQLGQFGANSANQIGNNMQNAGNARASGYINQGNAWANTANQVGQAGAWWMGQNRNQPGVG